MQESQLEQVRDKLLRMDDAWLLRSYQLYLDGLRLREGKPPGPSAVQYFVQRGRSFGGGGGDGGFRFHQLSFARECPRIRLCR